MAGKTRLERAINVKLPPSGGGGVVTEAGAEAVAPALPAPGAPTALAVTATYVLFSAVSPTAAANLSWRAPVQNLVPEGYQIQWSTSAAFTTPTTRSATQGQITATVDGLPVGTLVYFRVAAVYRQRSSPWSNTASATTPQDTAAPAAPTSLVTSWSGQTGDLSISYTRATSRNLRDERIRIYASNGGALLRDVYSAAGRYVWTRAQQYADTSGLYDASVYLVIESRSWSGVPSVAALTGTATLAVPAAPTGVSATWDGAAGALTFAWTPAATVAGYRLTLDGVARDLGITDHYAYTLSLNRAEHSGTADPAITWSLSALDALERLGTAATGTATLAVPSTPAGLAVDFAGPDLSVAWTGATVAGYRLTLDGVARDVGLANRYTYTLQQNGAEHAGTPDPVISVSLVALDALGQASAAATTTATNAAPAAPASVTATAFFSILSVSVTATEPADFRAYRYRLIQTVPSAADATWDAGSALQSRPISTGATYQIGVKVVDVFSQVSAETLSAAVQADALTLEELRAEAIYSDSRSLSSDTLKAQLADDVLVSGGVGYALGASWNWDRVTRPQIDRYRYVSFTQSGHLELYARTSIDGGTTWRYYAGPLVSSRVLTEVASEAAARAAAINTGLTAIVGSRFELPATVEARIVEIWHRNGSNAYTIREFYPRRLVQSDDMEAESIQAIHIGAGAVTADKLSVAQLSAITADMGTLTAGTITGATIRTAASGQRVELTTTGLRTYDSAGVLQVEATTATDGALTAGAGDVLLDNDGITIIALPDETYEKAATLKWVTGGIDTGRIRSYTEASRRYVRLEAAPDATDTLPGEVLLTAYGSGSGADVGFRVRGGTTASPLSVIDCFTQEMYIQGETEIDSGLTVAGALNVGTPGTPATAGATISRLSSSTSGAVTVATLDAQSTGTPAGGFGATLAFTSESSTTLDRNVAQLRATWATATDASRAGRLSLFAIDSAATREGLRIEASGTAPMLGFYGVAAVARQTAAAAAADLATVITLANDLRTKLIALGLLQ